MEENEEVPSPENEHQLVTHNSWVASGESTDSVQKTNSTISMTKSPISLWTMPVNGKRMNRMSNRMYSNQIGHPECVDAYLMISYMYYSC